jgi:hypothetical protein
MFGKGNILALQTPLFTFSFMSRYTLEARPS